ncbi:YkgJ family cysteine cluster protein [Haliangium sp.]|uniref:YkgJ family cysteine cluster protein n=1 Tax=Haliangium sp. TaxID=2663208 RepID=UPI003D0D288E
MSVEYVPVDHPRFVRAQRDIFVKTVAPDCMEHRCRLVHRRGRLELDACCRYGVDVDIGERDAIQARATDIAALLVPEARGRPWFEGPVHDDADFPSGRYVRTTTYDGGCIFLAHDRRGCAIHRAAVAGGWSFDGVKPHVCRLFPLSYESDAIVLSDDYADYSCAFEPDAPSVYRVSRDTLGAVFGPHLVRALDAAEERVKAT